MSKPKKKKVLITDMIRKPTAPPTQKIKSQKIERKRDPVGRNVKHKQKNDGGDEN